VAHIHSYSVNLFDSLIYLFLIEVWLLSLSQSIPGLKLKEENSKQSQANELFEKCLQAYRGDVENP